MLIVIQYNSFLVQFLYSRYSEKPTPNTTPVTQDENKFSSREKKQTLNLFIRVSYIIPSKILFNKVKSRVFSMTFYRNIDHIRGYSEPPVLGLYVGELHHTEEWRAEHQWAVWPGRQSVSQSPRNCLSLSLTEIFQSWQDKNIQS